jgi:RNA polymerase sigma-70 factor (ECF subfamily)
MKSLSPGVDGKPLTGSLKATSEGLTMTGEDDATLVSRAQQELPYRTGAFETLMRRHGPNIQALCRRFTRQTEEAEDLTQEVMLKVFFELPRFRGEAAFQTWLWRVTANHCLDYQRRQKTHRLETLESEETAHLPDDKQRQLQQTEARLDAERLLACLTPEDRLIVLLRLSVGLEFSEIAASLDLGLSAAKMRYTRALDKLRAIAQPGTQPSRPD